MDKQDDKKSEYKDYVDFHPGKFWCNFSYEEHKPRVERLLPGVEVIIPERIQKLG